MFYKSKEQIVISMLYACTECLVLTIAIYYSTSENAARLCTLYVPNMKLQEF